MIIHRKKSIIKLKNNYYTTISIIVYQTCTDNSFFFFLCVVLILYSPYPLSLFKKKNKQNFHVENNEHDYHQLPCQSFYF